jgi:hypothetical protein
MHYGMLDWKISISLVAKIVWFYSDALIKREQAALPTNFVGLFLWLLLISALNMSAFIGVNYQ